MLQLRLRTVNDSGQITAASRHLDTKQLSWTWVHNANPKLTFAVSRDDWEPVEYPFVVQVEYSIDGSRFAPVPDHSLFVIEEDSDDSKDTAKIVTYQGEGFVPWLLQGALIPWSTSHKDYRRTWVEPGREDASPGWILHGILTETKNAGWFPMLSWDFTGLKDSAEVAWPVASKVGLPWDFSQNALDVLTQLVSDDLCDFTATGTTLRLFTKNSLGEDRTEIVVGGPDFERVPVKVDASGQYSHVRAAPETIPWRNHVSNPRIRQRFGHRSIMVAQSGVKDAATSDKLVKPFILDGTRVDREEAYEWTPGPGVVAPFKDFRGGDMVTGLARGGRQPRRVIGLIIRQSDGPATVQARVGEKVLPGETKLRNKLASALMGGAVSGSGSGFPATPGPSPLQPARPAALRVTSNTGEWLADDTAQSTLVFAWEPVTQAIDGSEAVIVEYELWARLPHEELSRITAITATASPAVTLTQFEPDRPRLAAVRARDVNGQWSEFSLEELFTPALPASVVPAAPIGLRQASASAAFTAAGPVSTIELAWDPVTQSLDGDPVAVTGYTVWVDGAPLHEVTAVGVTVKLASEVTATYRVTARTPRAQSDPSAPLTLTGMKPETAARKPTGLTAKSGFGGVFAVWDGSYDFPGAGAHTVRVEARAGGAWLQQGTLTGAGEQPVSIGDVGEAIEIRGRAYDQLGRLTGTSDTVTVTRQALSLADIDPALAEQIGELEAGQTAIVQTVDGLNRTFISTDEPDADEVEGGLHQGDTWWKLHPEGGILEARIWDGTDWNRHRFVADSIIAIGSITGPLIRTNEVQVDHLSPNVGENLNLSANGSIILIAGQQEELASELSSVSDEARDAAGAATSASDAAAEAAARAAIAEGKALVAQAGVQQNADGLAQQQAVFAVTQSGAEVRSRDASNVFAIEPTGAAIVQGGMPVSQWDGARFISNEVITNRAQIAGHVFEKSGTRTVIRAI